MPSIDRESSIAPWRQVARFITDAIDSGTFPPGRRVPSEAEMVTLYGVGRNTVRKAIAHLVEAGRLYRADGMGTYVKGVDQDADSASE